MRRSFLPILGFLIFISSFASAENTVVFRVNGTITGSTCSIVLGSNELIKLDVQSQSKLQTPGSTAGVKRFRISLVGCATTAYIYFDNKNANVSAGGRLLNSVAPGVENGAENVELEILDSKGAAINLAADKGVQTTTDPTVDAASGSADFDYFVQYFSTGKVTAGKVMSSLTFVVESL